ncbi:MAG: hypothetical protein AAF267_16860 [Deinococcota bacterium]
MSLNLNVTLQYLLDMALALSVDVDGTTYTLPQGRLGVSTAIPSAPFVEVVYRNFDAEKRAVSSSATELDGQVLVSFFATRAGTDATIQEKVTNAFVEAFDEAIAGDPTLGRNVVRARLTRMTKRAAKINNKEYILVEAYVSVVL